MPSLHSGLWLPTITHGNIYALEAKICQIIPLLRSPELLTHDTDPSLSTVPKNEAEVQALRYLRGFLQVIKYTPDHDVREGLIQALNNLILRFNSRCGQKITPKQTYWFADQLSGSIQEKLGVSATASRNQVTMARDLCILLENHAPVITHSTSDACVTTQTSAIYKIRRNQHILNYAASPWFDNAKKFAGIYHGKATWLDNFFKANAEHIANSGIPAPPSARWLPIAGNIHKYEIVSTNFNPARKTQSRLLRTGTLSPFLFHNFPQQKLLAKEILYEMISDNLDEKIKVFRDLYGFNQDDSFAFFVNYQTLLSPIPGEENWNYIDNNARFVLFTKETLQAIRRSNEWENRYPKITLIMLHTNSPINKWTKLTRTYPHDKHAQLTKISQTKKLFIALILRQFKQLAPSADYKVLYNQLKKYSHLELLEKITHYFSENYITPSLLGELTLRAHACENLLNLLNHKPPFNALEPYQRNIMISALEFLAVGNQALAILGCKSGRDRTGIELSAIKTMQENKKAMSDWRILAEGIVNTLAKGHHFRAMHFHVPVAKIHKVQTSLFEKLPSQTQQDILELCTFSKTLKPYSTVYPEHPADNPCAFFKLNHACEATLQDLPETPTYDTKSIFNRIPV